MRYSRAYYILCTLGFLVILAGNVGNPFLPIYAAELGANELVIGIVMSCFFISRTFIEIPAGYISDRIGYRYPLILGFAASTLAAGVAAVAVTPFHLMVARALWGVGSALFFNVSMNVVVNMVASEDRGEAMGIFQGIEFTGSFMGAPIGGLLAAVFGFRVVFAVSAGILLITVVVMTISKELRTVTSREAVQAQRGGTRNGDLRDSLKAIRNFVFGVVCLTGFLRMFAMMGIFSTIAPIYLNVALGFDVATIGVLMGFRSVGMSAANFLAGRIARIVGKAWVFVVSLLFVSVSTLMILFFPSFWSQASLFLLGGAASGILMPLLPVTIAEVVDPSVRGTAIGFFRTSFDVGAIIAPIALTWIATIWGIENCFYVASALLFFNALLSLTLIGRIE